MLDFKHYIEILFIRYKKLLLKNAFISNFSNVIGGDFHEK